MKFITFIFLLCITACNSTREVSTSAQDSTQTVSEKDSVKLPAINPNNPVAVTILFGTDRKINKFHNTISFANVPANPGKPEYSVGYTIVSIPPGHQEGQIESPSIWKLEFHEDTLKHMIEKEIKLLGSIEFSALLKKNKEGHDAFVFVHGYNNGFKEAALRTAQLAKDIHLPITPIMFSWSSNGTVADYASDEDKVQLAVPAFEDFLKRIAREGNFKKIHLIAHSMGNRLISYALEALAHDSTDLKLDQIIMAAPDVYTDLFQVRFAKALIQKAHHVTVYSARNDWALAVSKHIHHNLRLGELGVPPPKYVFENVDVIDAGNQKTDFIGHDRFARSATIISDMDDILRNDLNAEQRNIPRKRYGDFTYYYFK